MYLNSTLVLIPTTSKHYGNMRINLCKLFNLSPGILCGRAPKYVKCRYRMPEVVFTDNVTEFCYSGTIMFSNYSHTNENPRPHILKAIELDMRLNFSSYSLKYWDAFVEAFGVKSLPLSGFDHLTVVHWRRGDQLRSRCLERTDTSVNCGTASELIDEIKASKAQEEIVYIATNERPSSRQMKKLRAEGYLAYNDLILNIGNDSLPNSIQILAMEVKLMMMAKTFLAWGVSEIDDVVENERMRSGKQYCVNKAYLNNTWCAHRLPHKRSLEPRRIYNRIGKRSQQASNETRKPTPPPTIPRLVLLPPQ